MKRFKIKYIIIFLLLIVILGISGKLNQKLAQTQEIEDKIDISPQLLSYYKEYYSQDIIMVAQCDLNMDKKDDAVVIYSENKSQNFMVVVVTDGDSYYLTEPVKAPLENQSIKFKDIDEKDEMEVIVSGEKNGNLGYAIFRIEDKLFKDIFAEGMESCC